MKKHGLAASAVVVIIAVVVAALGIGLFVAKKGEETSSMVSPNSSQKESATEEKNEITKTEEKTEKGEMAEKYAGIVLAGKSSPLLDFTMADYNAALKSDKLIVLYFYANWCPICRLEFPVMQNVFNDLTTDKVIGFRVNYNDNETGDDEKQLAREFGVAYQHTKVFVKDGKRILKSPETWNARRYETEIDAALREN